MKWTAAPKGNKWCVERLMTLPVSGDHKIVQMGSYATREVADSIAKIMNKGK